LRDWAKLTQCLYWAELVPPPVFRGIFSQSCMHLRDFDATGSTAGLVLCKTPCPVIVKTPAKPASPERISTATTVGVTVAMLS